MPDDLPGDPVSALQAGAAQQHEMFLAWQAAGFSEPQALELLKVVIATMIARS